MIPCKVFQTSQMKVVMYSLFCQFAYLLKIMNHLFPFSSECVVILFTPWILIFDHHITQTLIIANGLLTFSIWN